MQQSDTDFRLPRIPELTAHVQPPKECAHDDPTHQLKALTLIETSLIFKDWASQSITSGQDTCLNG